MWSMIWTRKKSVLLRLVFSRPWLGANSLLGALSQFEDERTRCPLAYFGVRQVMNSHEQHMVVYQYTYLTKQVL